MNLTPPDPSLPSTSASSSSSSSVPIPGTYKGFTKYVTLANDSGDGKIKLMMNNNPYFLDHEAPTLIAMLYKSQTQAAPYHYDIIEFIFASIIIGSRDLLLKKPTHANFKKAMENIIMKSNRLSDSTFSDIRKIKRDAFIGQEYENAKYDIVKNDNTFGLVDMILIYDEIVNYMRTYHLPLVVASMNSASSRIPVIYTEHLRKIVPILAASKLEVDSLSRDDLTIITKFIACMKDGPNNISFHDLTRLKNNENIPIFYNIYAKMITRLYSYYVTDTKDSEDRLAHYKEIRRLTIEQTSVITPADDKHYIIFLLFSEIRDKEITENLKQIIIGAGSSPAVIMDYIGTELHGQSFATLMYHHTLSKFQKSVEFRSLELDTMVKKLIPLRIRQGLIARIEEYKKRDDYDDGIDLFKNLKARAKDVPAGLVSSSYGTGLDETYISAIKLLRAHEVLSLDNTVDHFINNVPTRKNTLLTDASNASKISINVLKRLLAADGMEGLAAVLEPIFRDAITTAGENSSIALAIDNYKKMHVKLTELYLKQRHSYRFLIKLNVTGKSVRLDSEHEEALHEVVGRYYLDDANQLNGINVTNMTALVQNTPSAVDNNPAARKRPRPASEIVADSNQLRFIVKNRLLDATFNAYVENHELIIPTIRDIYQSDGTPVTVMIRDKVTPIVVTNNTVPRSQIIKYIILNDGNVNFFKYTDNTPVDIYMIRRLVPRVHVMPVVVPVIDPSQIHIPGTSTVNNPSPRTMNPQHMYMNSQRFSARPGVNWAVKHRDLKRDFMTVAEEYNTLKEMFLELKKELSNTNGALSLEKMMSSARERLIAKASVEIKDLVSKWHHCRDERVLDEQELREGRPWYDKEEDGDVTIDDLNGVYPDNKAKRDALLKLLDDPHTEDPQIRAVWELTRQSAKTTAAEFNFNNNNISDDKENDDYYTADTVSMGSMAMHGSFVDPHTNKLSKSTTISTVSESQLMKIAKSRLRILGETSIGESSRVSVFASDDNNGKYTYIGKFHIGDDITQRFLKMDLSPSLNVKDLNNHTTSHVVLYSNKLRLHDVELIM